VRNVCMSVIGLATVLGLSGTARAQEGGSEIEGRWTFSFRGGPALPLSGDFHGGSTGTVLGLPTTVDAKDYGDVYGTTYRSEAQLGYGVSERVELFAGGSYAKKSADPLQVGNVGGLALNAQFGDYEQIGVEGGMRYFLRPASTLKPYLALSGGVRFLESITTTLSVPAANVTLRDVPFYDRSTVGTAAALIGVRYDLSSAFSLGLETGPRYQGKLEGVPTLAGTGLESINDTGDRWSMPVLFTASLRF